MMKGYKCDLPIDELNKLRCEFWCKSLLKLATKVKEDSPIWKQIRQACIMDEGKYSILLNREIINDYKSSWS